MTSQTNEYDQPVGPDLGAWTPPAEPPWRAIEGSGVRIEPMHRAQHAVPLYHVFKHAPETMWTYLSFGPFMDAAELGQTIDAINEQSDWQPYAIVVDSVVVGFFNYMRINAHAGSIEVGGVVFSPELQRTRASTEAQYILMKNAFDLGYRRYEWKCDDLNAPSRAAAERLGFSYEGTFKNATHYKGRSRDTAWYSITDDEWPAIDAAFQTWLDPENFNEDGSQKTRLQTPAGRP